MRRWQERPPVQPEPGKPTHVLVFGLAASGKSSLIHRLVGNSRVVTFPGRTIRRLPYGETVLVEVPGTSEWRDRWQRCEESLDGPGLFATVFVVDTSDSMNVALASQFFIQVASSPGIIEAPLLLVFNKWEARNQRWQDAQDLVQFFGVTRGDIEESKMSAPAAEVHPFIGVVAASVTSGDGISSISQWLTSPKRFISGDFFRDSKSRTLAVPTWWPPRSTTGSPFWD